MKINGYGLIKILLLVGVLVIGQACLHRRSSVASVSTAVPSLKNSLLQDCASCTNNACIMGAHDLDLRLLSCK